MSVIVDTYNHPRNWRKHKVFSSIENAIHICATRNTADGIADQYDELNFVYTIHEVFQGVFYKWHSPEYKLEQYLTLAKIIRDIYEEENLKQSFIYNLTNLQDTIRTLVVCNVDYKDFSNENILTNRELFFKKIFKKYLELNDEIVMDTKWRLNKGNKPRNFIKKTLNKINLNKHKLNQEDNPEIKNETIKDIPDDCTKIVLHGFYFITPEQQVFLKFLQRSGYSLHFFQFYDDRFPKTFNFSRKFISSKFDWTDSWNIQQGSNNEEGSLGQVFLNTFEGNRIPKDYKKTTVLEYDSFFEFLEEVIIKNYPINDKADDDNVSIIATSADMLNEVLIQYYPERYPNRYNFLNYPIGQFLLKLHEMHTPDGLVITEDIIVNAFSSGWLNEKKITEVEVRAQDFTSDLISILPYFTNCELVEEWLEKFEELLDIYENILPLFVDEEDDRIIESIQSPFAKLSYLSLDIETVKQIKSFTVLLIEMAESLFADNDEGTEIEKHFDRLSELIIKNNPLKYNTILEEYEQQLIETIHSRIMSIDSEHYFMYEDIEEAIRFYLSGKFNENEEKLIIPFIEVDGEAFKKSREKVYLTGLDEKGLPLSKFEIPWPLQEETFESLAAIKKPLQLHLLRNKYVKHISRYLLYIALEFIHDTELELSWIKNFLDRKNLGPTIYLNYLNYQRKTTKTEDYVNEDMDNLDLENLDIFLKEDTETYSFEKAMESFDNNDVMMEYAFCPRRFYYGFILEKYPTFKEVFHHKPIYSNTVKFIKKSGKLTTEKARQEVDRFFPQLNTFERISLTDNDKKMSLSKSRLNNSDFIISRIRFQFPWLSNNYKNKMEERIKPSNFSIENLTKKLLSEEEFEANSGYNCRFCPYLSICDEGEFAIDVRKEE